MNTNPPLLVLGTHNLKKLAEMTTLLTPLGFALKTLADFDNAIEVVEDGDSFSANATLKATQQATNLGHWVLAEDSGLAVDALKGAPGIYAARYAGPDCDDLANNQKLLTELSDIAIARRGAHYVCHMTLADPQGNVQADCEAYCRGRIRETEAGSGGFGYDPLFEVVEYHRTFGQMEGALKSILSHRARATRLLIPQLVALQKAGKWKS